MISLSANSREVYPGLWIGAYPTNKSEIKDQGFTLHIDCRGESPPPAGASSEVESFYLGLFDNPNGALPEDTVARIKTAGKRLAAYVRSGRKCLVTCYGGMNRSALVAAFAMHELTGKPGKDIVEIIREKRGLPTKELEAVSASQYHGLRALNNERFVALIETLKTKSYDSDVLIYDVVGGAYTKASAVSGPALGGSELEVVQIAHALAARGHSVTVATRITEAVKIDGVRYIPHTETAGFRAKTLYVQRHSPVPLPAVEADRVIIRTTDMNEAAYRTHDAILSSGEAELLCVSQWQASLFPHATRRAIVPSPLGAMPLVAKVPGRFVYASSPAKGLEATLGVWMRLKAAHAEELASAKLLVASPNYTFGSAPQLSQEMQDAGVEYIPKPSLAAYRELIASAQGVFYASVYSETACMIAAMAERSHTRFHFWPVSGPSGVPEMLTNQRLVAKDEAQFEADFMAAWREPDRSEWYATGPLKDLSVDALIPTWERALHLVDQVPDDPKAPLYLPASTGAGAAPGQSNVPRLFVATPAYGGMMTMPYVSSVVGMMCSLQRIGCTPTLHLIGNESLITRARNNCVGDFLKTDCTHLIFIDADIGFQAQHMADMACSGLDVVFGAYPKKNISWPNVLLAAQSGKARTPQDLEQYSADFALNFDDEAIATGQFRVIERNGMAFMHVKEASTGFCCIKREVIEKMIERYGSELEYTCDSNMGYNEKRHALFDCPIVAEGESDAPLMDLRVAAKAFAKANPATSNTWGGGIITQALADTALKFAASVDKPVRYLSEDYGFSRRWASMGGDVWVYMGANLTHTGTHTYSGNFSKQFDGADELATTWVAP